MTLHKNILRTYNPGNPGSPGFPGQPARPAYTSIETRCGPTQNFLVPVFEDPITGERRVGSGPGELIGYVVRTFPGGCHNVTIFHPATPAIAPIPSVPGTPGHFVTDAQLGWNAGAYSILGLDHDVETTFRIAAVPGGIFIGLANNPTGVAYQTIDYAFNFRHPIVDVWERGAWKWGVTNFTPEDDFRLQRIAGVVRYWKNTTLLYTSLTQSVGPLNVDCSMYAGGDRVN